MTRVDHILPHVPVLRRYAFALTGTREAGDALVQTCLEAFAARPDAVQASDTKVALFELFHEINGVPTLNLPVGRGQDVESETRLFVHIGKLEGEARAALTMTCVIGLSVEEAATALKRAPAEVRAEIADARRRLAMLASARVLIIEDDYLIAQEIAQVVAHLGQQVTGFAATYEEAMACAAEQVPTLVLADVQLRDGRITGLLAGHALARDHQVPLILITAYPERLLQGPDVQPLKVLTKPFNYASLRSAISSSLASAPLAA